MTDRLIDHAAVAEFTQNDAELLADLAVIFVRFLPSSLSKLNLAIENDDPTMLGQTAHQLTGQLSYFFCNRLIEQSRQLEQHARSEQLPIAAAEQVEHVWRGVQQLLDELRTLTNLELRLDLD